ncbi:hypothetical protein [Jannaschia pohangensis]|uniref:Uncharacterized protein n=1 Tax=Jannaschia pohangensis TaxID=390807 RepID=A0A1I3MWX6_9RHOB|nr:hypothetical protein [Jannaschia pohangensis]SFJ01498.1 hypothetical protein SAMN04488095_1984 [Jannaschia pohangensis]
MTDIISITAPTSGAPGNNTPACPIFGAAIQGLERLLRADAEAQGLPDGDPAYYNGSTDADEAFSIAIDAAEHASCRASQPVYRGAANILICALNATRAHDVRMAVMAFGFLLREGADDRDRTVHLSLSRAASVLEDLADAWEGRETTELNAWEAEDASRDNEDPFYGSLSIEDWDDDLDLGLAPCI